MGDVSNPHGNPLRLDPLVTPVAQATTVHGVSGGSTDVAVTRSQKRKRDEKEALEVSQHPPVSRVCGVGRARRLCFRHWRARDPCTRAPSSLRRVFPLSVLTAQTVRASVFPLFSISSEQDRKASVATAEALEKKARATSGKSVGGKVHQSPPLRPDDKVSAPLRRERRV